MTDIATRESTTLEVETLPVNEITKTVIAQLQRPNINVRLFSRAGSQHEWLPLADATRVILDVDGDQHIYPIARIGDVCDQLRAAAIALELIMDPPDHNGDR